MFRTSRRPLVLSAAALAALLAAVPAAGAAGQRSDKEMRAKLRSSVRSLSFFESGPVIPAHDRRQYQTRFAAGLTRFINWELGFEMPAPGRRIEYEVEAVWKKADGSLLARQSHKAFIEPDWTRPTTGLGWGSRTWGYWQPGRYAVELFLDKSRVARGEFEVLTDEAFGVRLATLWDIRVPLYPGTNIVRCEEQRIGTKQCRALVETGLDKAGTLAFFRDRLKAGGWVFDTELLAGPEDGSLAANDLVWGMVNMYRDPYTLTAIIPSDKRTGGGRTLAELTLTAGGDKLDPSTLLAGPAQPVLDEGQMNRRFANATWAVTVLSAKAEGQTITKELPGGGGATFKVQDPGQTLIRLTVRLERLDGQPIKTGFILRPAVVDRDGQSYDCAAAGTLWGEYFDFAKGGSQSILTPTRPVDTLEYVFAVPSGTVITELDWPDLPPISIRVR